MMDERYGRVRWGAGEDRVRTSPANWKLPFKWNEAARLAGRIDTVFCLSLGDIWDNEVDPLWRRDAFRIMDVTPNLLYLLLSKRVGNAIKMCDPMSGNPCLPSNAALGATMVNQEEWDRDLPKLKEAGRILDAQFTFASVEPMLGPIDARGELPSWVIVGGESGSHARPMHPDWVRSLRRQCADAGVPYFFKQWGEWKPLDQFDEKTILKGAHSVVWRDGRTLYDHDIADPPVAVFSIRFGKKDSGRLLDGKEHNGMPSMEVR